MRRIIKLAIVLAVLLVFVIIVFFLFVPREKQNSFLGIASNAYCGNNVCQDTENQQNCCMDCGCSTDQVCVNNTCQSTATSSNTTLSTTTTAVSSAQAPSQPPAGLGSPTGTATPTTSSIGSFTTTTLRCSLYNCAGCENITECIDVGCTWCKIGNHCLRICQ